MGEDTTSSIDLSAMKLKYKGSKKEIVSVTLSADQGTLEADSTKKVHVTGSGTGALTFTGTVKELDKYFNNSTAIEYTGAQDAFGEGAATFTLTADAGGNTVTLATAEVDITDTPDVRTGTPGADTLIGDGGVDIIDGLAGNDVIEGGAGADTLDGNSGTDWLYYVGSNAGVSVDLNVDGSGFQTVSGGDAEGDIVTGFENVRGSNSGDVLIGDEGDNYLIGLAGNDTIAGNGGNDIIRGGEGADILEGGAGVDVLQYEGSASGVTVDLNEDGSGFQTVSGGDAEGDIVSGFENVFGSDYGDVIVGNAGNNYLIGFDGDDFIDGGAGNDVIRGGAGADTLLGGDGVDLLQYTDAGSGVTVDLSTSLGFGGDAEGDTFTGFENVYGSDYGDVLTGDGGKNVLFGYDGDDTIFGGAGNDTIRGGLGADRMDGGDGIDWLRYAGASSGVVVDLNADSLGFQSASGGEADGDIVSGFENVYGTSYDDVLTGNDLANILYGGSGADTFVFRSALGNGNVDRILDFNSSDDTIQIDHSVFVGLSFGDLDASQFVINETGAAENAAHRIIFESDTGHLRFDVDGTGAAESFLFATLQAGLSIDETDIFVI
ncbi:MAG: calcium-binding protein [Paracoccaceae bacterium]